jgi:predicted metal-dependent hydrolase
VTNQRSRFGSCTPEDGTIRISHHVAEHPTWVRDYVLMHELAHLVDPSHSRRFWNIVGRYPQAERARGYLMALGTDR